MTMEMCEASHISLNRRHVYINEGRKNEIKRRYKKQKNNIYSPEKSQKLWYIFFFSASHSLATDEVIVRNLRKYDNRKSRYINEEEVFFRCRLYIYLYAHVLLDRYEWATAWSRSQRCPRWQKYLTTIVVVLWHSFVASHEQLIVKIFKKTTEYIVTTIETARVIYVCIYSFFFFFCVRSEKAPKVTLD